MKPVIFSTLVSVLAGAASANPQPLPPLRGDASITALKRASPQDPNDYAPYSIACPSPRPTVRDATGLSSQETSWLRTRRQNTLTPMKELLGRLNISGFDASSYIQKYSNNLADLPNIAIAASGGGYRAMMNGAGVMAAFDSRTPGSTGSGQLGGLLQSATYAAGLSGGGWLMGSLWFNNFTSVQAIIDGDDGSLWDFTNSIFEGPVASVQSIATTAYLAALEQQVSEKKSAGFNISLTDFWGRALAYQFINAPDGGPGYTFSSIQNDTLFSSGQTPMPILIADSRLPGESAIPESTTIFEFNPWELGSWDATVSGFAPLQYVGSNFSDGALLDSQTCVAGLDNAGFVIGTSSSLFNLVLTELIADGDIPSTVLALLKGILGPLDEDDNDIAQWQPNPFFNYHSSTNGFASLTDLPLVDGGENGENIPLHPLIQPARAVDVVFAIDSSADTVADGYAGWPNGTSLVATYQRSQLSNITNNIPFPAVPDQNSFINLGLNSRPTFFGCNPSNYTSSSSHPGPLIVYLPNAPYNYLSNFSTFQFSYNNSVRDAVIGNGYAMATQGNGTLDSNWPTCVGCAILQRSLARTGTTVPAVCAQCFKDYCWNGTVDSAAVTYMPDLKLKEVTKAGGGSAGGGSGAATALGGPERAWMAALAALVVAAFMSF